MGRRCPLLVAVSVMFFSSFFVIPYASSAGTHPNPLREEDPELVRKATALLHITGEAPEVNFNRWRLRVVGEKVEKSLRLPYWELSALRQEKRNVVLVCPGAFTDRADWEGVPLSIILEMAGIEGDYDEIVFVGLDGFKATFTKNDVDNHWIILALKVNGVTLPPEHGFPVRVVAEDILGGKWVKWIDYIKID
jgi:DMSO/TMAO reductase YedYZ molybdopterin-dependent catalytic subunit